VYPLGWDTADRLVWGTLRGEGKAPGVLVTADLDGRNVREWLRITGDDALDAIEWTTSLAR
jgi:hypothetical protein